MASTLLTETKVRIQALDSVNSLRLHRNRKWVVSLQSPGKSGEIPQSSPPALDAALAYPMPFGPHGQTPPSGLSSAHSIAESIVPGFSSLPTHLSPYEAPAGWGQHHFCQGSSFFKLEFFFVPLRRDGIRYIC